MHRLVRELDGVIPGELLGARASVRPPASKQTKAAGGPPVLGRVAVHCEFSFVINTAEYRPYDALPACQAVLLWSKIGAPTPTHQGTLGDARAAPHRLPHDATANSRHCHDLASGLHIPRVPTLAMGTGTASGPEKEPRAGQRVRVPGLGRVRVVLGSPMCFPLALIGPWKLGPINSLSPTLPLAIRQAAEMLLVTAINEQRDIVFDGTMMWAPFVEQTIAMVRWNPPSLV